MATSEIQRTEPAGRLRVDEIRAVLDLQHRLVVLGEHVVIAGVPVLGYPIPAQFEQLRQSPDVIEMWVGRHHEGDRLVRGVAEIMSSCSVSNDCSNGGILFERPTSTTTACRLAGVPSSGSSRS